MTEVIVVARLAAMCGFIMLGCPNSKKKFIFITRTTLFSKKNIKFKVALRPRWA